MQLFTNQSRRTRRVLGGAGIGLAIVGTLKALAGCELATGFRGDGYSSRDGVTLKDAGPTVVVGLTNAQLDASRRRAFDDHTQRVIAALPGTPGYIGHSVRTRVLGQEVWTMTIWKDHASMDAFVRSPTHQEAIRQGMPAVVAVKFHRFTMPVAEVPPSWRTVKTILKDVQARDYGPTPASPEAVNAAPREVRP